MSASSILFDPKYKFILSLIKGIRNGIVYGCKIRFPHALVMTLLFKSGSFQEKAEGILEATFIHAKNLASFVVVYRLMLRLLALLRVKNAQKDYITVFLSACIGGYLVFGRYNKINEQINLYLLSRILYGAAHLLYKMWMQHKPKGKGPSKPFFPLFAAIMWGCVLTLFEFHTDCLQSSLQSSMTYLYRDSTRWSCWRDLLWVNELPPVASS